MITSNEWTPSDVGLRAGRLDRRQAIREHGGENGDHLAITVVGSGEFVSNPFQRGR